MRKVTGWLGWTVAWCRAVPPKTSVSSAQSIPHQGSPTPRGREAGLEDAAVMTPSLTSAGTPFVVARLQSAAPIRSCGSVPWSSWFHSRSRSGPVPAEEP